MNIVQTFWTCNNSKQNPLSIKAGWLSAEYHWMSWALSCLQLRKYYPNVELVTDSAGKEVLIDRLGLTYTTVSTVLEGRLSAFPSHTWALAKISSYSIQRQPFVHVDGDVFLWAPLAGRLTGAAVLAQNLEIGLPFYQKPLQEMQKHFEFVPPFLRDAVSEDRSIHACNCGIFGGSNLRFIQLYCNAAFDLISRNQNRLSRVSTKELNCVLEQCLLYYLAREQRQPIRYFSDEPVKEPSYVDYARLLDIPQVAYIHTVSHFKKIAFVCDALAKRLRKEYPDYYYRIVKQCAAAKVEMRAGFYRSPAQVLKASPAPMARLQAIPAFKTDLSVDLKHFYRTLAAIRYCHPSASPAVITPKAIAGMIRDTTCPRRRQRLRELYRLERKKYQITTGMHDAARSRHLYEKAKQQFEQIDRVFAQTHPALLRTTLLLNATVHWMDLSCNWDHAADVPLNKYMEYKFAQPRRPQKLALVCNPMNLQVDEVYLDRLDQLVCMAFGDGSTIGDAMTAVSAGFEGGSENVANEKFTTLIINTVKLLMHKGILVCDDCKDRDAPYEVSFYSPLKLQQ